MVVRKAEVPCFCLFRAGKFLLNDFMHWPQITLIGVGLLGGSLGLAIKQNRLADRVTGYVRRQESVEECLDVGVVDAATTNLRDAVKDAGLAILCTPISQMQKLGQQMLPHLKPGAILTDVGSVKGTICEPLTRMFQQAQCHFVGSHPMAGSEKSGVAAARVDLFQGAVTALTPLEESTTGAVDSLAQFWKDVGSHLLFLTPETHDDLVARSSHLTHVVASALANYVLSPVHPKEQRELCANGFRDTTRIASGSPEMWRDIALANSRNLSRVLGVFIEDLQEFKHALESEDARGLQEFFGQAKNRRDNWCQEAAGSLSPLAGDVSHET